MPEYRYPSSGAELPTSEPAAPSSGVALWARQLGLGLPWMLAARDPDLRSAHLAASQVDRHIVEWSPGSGALFHSRGCLPVNTGTWSNPTPTSASAATRYARMRATSAAGAGSTAAIRSTVPFAWRGNAAGLGGFLFAFLGVNLSTIQAQSRAFVGLIPDAIVLPNANPSTFLNAIGFYFDSTQGTWRFGHNDGAGAMVQLADLGASFPVSTAAVVDFYIGARANGSTVGFYAERRDAVAVAAQESGAADLPASTTFLNVHVSHNNGTTAAAAAIDLRAMHGEMGIG